MLIDFQRRVGGLRLCEERAKITGPPAAGTVLRRGEQPVLHTGHLGILKLPSKTVGIEFVEFLNIVRRNLVMNDWPTQVKSSLPCGGRNIKTFLLKLHASDSDQR